MARYGAGEDACFAVVYEGVCPTLERYLMRRTGNPRQVEDILQHTFLKMHHHRGSFRPGEPVLPWAQAIALRLLIDRVRSQRREARVMSGAPVDEICAASGLPGPDQIVLATETLDQIEAELQQLPEAHRRAFEVVRIEGRSLAEAALELNTTVAGVKLRLFRAMERLRSLVRQDQDPE